MSEIEPWRAHWFRQLSGSPPSRMLRSPIRRTLRLFSSNGVSAPRRASLVANGATGPTTLMRHFGRKNIWRKRCIDVRSSLRLRLPRPLPRLKARPPPPFHRHRAGEGRKARGAEGAFRFDQRFHVRIRIAAAGQGPERQSLPGPDRHAGGAKRWNGGGGRAFKRGNGRGSRSRSDERTSMHRFLQMFFRPK